MEIVCTYNIVNRWSSTYISWHIRKILPSACRTISCKTCHRSCNFVLITSIIHYVFRPAESSQPLLGRLLHSLWSIASYVITGMA